jgi:hypothetical protein
MLLILTDLHLPVNHPFILYAALIASKAKLMRVYLRLNIPGYLSPAQR